MKSRQVVFDNTLRQITKSSQLLFWQRSITHPNADFNSVSWKPRYRGDGGGGEGGVSVTTRYPITLSGPQKELGLYEEMILEGARKVTRELGVFLDLEQKHGDTHLMAQASSESSACAGKLGTRQRLLSLFGGDPTWRVFRSETSLTYVQTFDPFTRFIFGVFAVVGAVVLLSTWSDLPNVVWEKVGVGSFFFIIGVPFLLGRRGVTIDTGNAAVDVWVRLLVPIRSRKHDLSAFSAVGFEEQLEEVNRNPCSVGRIFLVGDNDERFVLFKWNPKTIKPFVSEIAGFLKFPIVNDVQNTS